jgi:predicted GNAT family N-acyltransferase
MASTYADLEAVARLRYEVYIAEQGKPYPEADHSKRLLTDALDDADPDIVIVEADGQPVGTVRCNLFSHRRVVDCYRATFDPEALLEATPDQVSVCSRLAVLPAYRFSIVRALLFSGIFEFAFPRGVRYCFAACAPILRRMFKAYGFREFAGPVSDDIVGRLHRLLLVMDDTAHFARINSPFLSIVHRHGVMAVHRPWLENYFAKRDRANAD